MLGSIYWMIYLHESLDQCQLTIFIKNGEHHIYHMVTKLNMGNCFCNMLQSCWNNTIIVNTIKYILSTSSETDTYLGQWKHQLCGKMSAPYQHHLCYLRNGRTSNSHPDLFPVHCPWICKRLCFTDWLF